MYIVSLMLRETIQYTGSLHASRILHRKTLDKILHSPIRFFDTTPLGRIITRFTRDMDTVDQQVTNVSANVMVYFLGTLTATGVITYVTPQFLVPSLVISVLFVVIAIFYTRTSRELKRHESTTNSPVYSHFAETLNEPIDTPVFFKPFSSSLHTHFFFPVLLFSDVSWPTPHLFLKDNEASLRHGTEGKRARVEEKYKG